MRAAWLALVLVLLCACMPTPAPAVVADAGAMVADAVQDVATPLGKEANDIANDAGDAIVREAAPVAVAIADVIQPEPAVVEALPPAPELPDPAIALITRWEVTSQAHYNRKLSGVYCPPPPSGPTGGIGYDFGHQTKAEIRRVWGWHPAVDRLVQASGQRGDLKCNAWAKANRDIRISWDEAQRVFASDSLPRYRGMAMRALPGLDRQTPGHIGGLTSLGYRRGWAMEGERMREKRVIRADCVPNNNADCSAAQVVAMCRIWQGKPGGKGQCNRSHDEARVIRS